MAAPGLTQEPGWITSSGFDIKYSFASLHKNCIMLPVVQIRLADS
jgi:hypothetical protein